MALVLRSDDVCGNNMETKEGEITMLSRSNTGEILSKWRDFCPCASATQATFFFLFETGKGRESRKRLYGGHHQRHRPYA